jgi:hypothetical protein
MWKKVGMGGVAANWVSLIARECAPARRPAESSALPLFRPEWTDDQGASDRKSDGKASNSASGVLGFRRKVPSTILMSAMNVVVLPWSGCVQAPLLVHE